MDDIFGFEDDELDEIEVIIHGVPRERYIRSDYFHSLDEVNFFKRFRLTKCSVLQLLPFIEDHLEFPYNINQCVSPMNQLLICLRFYATANHLISVADYAGVHTSTVSRIVVRVSTAIASLYGTYIKMPRSRNEIRDCQNKFFEIASFPRVIGVLDCTHVKIQSPGGNDAEIFRNRKQYFSVNVQAICDSQLTINNVVARWPGSTHDATIFNNSNIRAEFEIGSFPNSILLGDSGYPLKRYLLTPLLNPVAQADQLYNQSHIRTRNAIERCFGVIKRRFPILAYGCRLKLNTVLRIIVATCILHNLARQLGEAEPPNLDEVDMHILNQRILDGQIPHVPNHDDPNINDGVVRADFIRNYFARL